MVLSKRSGVILARIRMIKLNQIINSNITEVERSKIQRIKNRPVKFLIKPMLWVELLDLLCDIVIRLNKMYDDMLMNSNEEVKPKPQEVIIQDGEFFDEQGSYDDEITEEENNAMLEEAIGIV